MKKLKVFIILAGIILAGMLVLSNTSYAADSSANPMYLGLFNNSNARKTGFYDYLDEGTMRRPDIKIVKYDNAQGQGNVDYSTQIYCLRHGIGFGSEGATGAVVPYTQYFDMKQPETIGNEYKEAIGISGGVTPNYNKIMWILNNMANPHDQTSVNNLFQAAGIDIQDFKGDKETMTPEAMADIIEAAQQMAIWYYTNPQGAYHPKGHDETLRVGPDNQNNTKTAVAEKYYSAEIDYPLNDLYKYLVEEADRAVAAGYSYQTSATTVNFNKDSATYVDDGSNYKFGPYSLTYTNNPGLTVNVQGDVPIGNVRIVNDQGVDYPGNNVTEKILNARGANFYAIVPKSTNVKSFKIVVNAQYTTTDVTYWSTAANIAQRNQPVAVVQKAPKNFNDEKIIPIIEQPKIFDLALRKFITNIRSAAGVEKPVSSREPVITSDSLEGLAKESSEFRTTAVKTHTKQPLEVETGDIVTYTIRVYNEGEIDGIVTELTDYLPAGLQLAPNSQINQANQWVANGKTLTSSLHSKDVIGAFNKNAAKENLRLNYLDYKVECVVGDTTNLTVKDLTNVAEITGEVPANGEQIIDRDSTARNLTQNQIQNYNPGTSERGKGYEDDDDYEPLKPKPVIPPTPQSKEFDLALRKFITGIKSADGTAKQVPSREPIVTQDALEGLANGSSEFRTTAVKTHTKQPLEVEPGDIVKYTIRVYNEGDIDGCVTELTDYLPAGLELAPNSQINQANQWTANGKVLTSSLHARDVIRAFNKNDSKENLRLDYLDFQVECIVSNSSNLTVKDLTNVTEITGEKTANGELIKDRDSTYHNLTQDQIQNYNPGTSERGKGYEDDDDYEPLKTKPRQPNFDLALRKFIVSIRSANGTAKNIASREPIVTQDALEGLVKGTSEFRTTAVKTHTKQPLEVEAGDIVTYTIRVYNEGDVDGLATEITDYLPDGLELAPNSQINQANQWVANGKTITSSLHARDSIKAFNKDAAKQNLRLDYVDFQIECVVTNKANLTVKDLTNVTEITGETTANGEKLKDRDSSHHNLTEDQIRNYNTRTSERGRGYEDDDDYEPLKPVQKTFDLSLRKFITAVNDKQITSRIPNPDVTPLVNGTDTTAIYKHQKEPVVINQSDIVTYTIRVYNEGDIDGYADEVADHLPEQLEFLNNDFNKQYGWILDPADSTGTTIKTDYLSEKRSKDNIIKKFNGKTLDYKELKVQTRIKSGVKTNKYLTDIAEITESHNEFNIPDRDNHKRVERPNGDDLPGYHGNELNKKDLTDKNYHYRGQEDDDDFEKVVVKEFDLALRKFITQVNKEAVTSRIPQVDTSKFGTIGQDGKEVTTMTYNHPKDPVKVNTTDIVTYTIRVYNEGSMNGYATEVKDDVPAGLEFLPDNETNKEYRWQLIDKDNKPTTNIKEAVSITTDYLSKAQEKTLGANLIKAFDKDTMQTPDFKDVKIAFKVIEPQTSDRILINKAQISKHHDENGNEVKDRDSTPNKWNEGEDDQDIEKVYVRYFDLSLRKWVTQVMVIEDGKQKVKDTGHYAEQDPEPVVKVEVNRKRLKNTVVKFRYSIRVKNEGEIEGYAKEISDYIPSGLKFNKADNPDWTEKNGKIVTTKLKDTLLKPGQTAEVSVLLTWINGEDNMKVMTNTAEISEDYNKYHTPDRDSTPNNRKKGEDDQDDAPVALTTVSGIQPKYIGITVAGLSIIAIGGVLVKRFI